MSKPRHPLSRAEVTQIVKRFVKPDEYQARRDIMLFYKVFAEFPDAAFWRVHDIGFQLNCIAWLLSEDGKAHIRSALAIYHLDIEPEPEYHMEETKVGADARIRRTVRSVSDLFKPFKPLDHEQTK